MYALTRHAANRALNTRSRQAFAHSTSPSHAPRRAPEFGLGYGSSSGYASPRRYVADTGPRMFRFA